MSTRETANPTPSGHCQPGAIRLSAYLRAMFGLGDCGCYAPFSRMSSGRPSWHVHGEAIDLCCNWFNSTARKNGERAFDWAVAHREELNLQQTIFGDRIYDISYGVRGYHHDDHKNHIHIALGHAVAQNWTASGNPIPAGYDEPKIIIEEDEEDMAIFAQGDGPKTIGGQPGPGAKWWLVTSNWMKKRWIGSVAERDFIWKAGATKGDKDVHVVPQAWIDRVPEEK